MRPVHLIVYSDYRCPGCDNGSVRLADQDLAVTGAFPLEFYRRWVERVWAEREAESPSA